MEDQGFSYTSGTLPKGYRCPRCQASGCKLWREYGAMGVYLLCALCAAEEENIDISDLDDKGTYMVYDYHPEGKKTDQIGWYVPAILDEDGLDYYWGGSSPPEGIQWWENLPTFPAEAVRQ